MVLGQTYIIQLHACLDCRVGNAHTKHMVFGLLDNTHGASLSMQVHLPQRAACVKGLQEY